MMQKRPMQTKALSAYLTARQTTLSTTLARIGADQEFRGETLDDATTGCIARLFGMTPERLAELVAPYATLVA